MPIWQERRSQSSAGERWEPSSARRWPRPGSRRRSWPGGTTNEDAIRNAFDGKKETIISVKSREEGVTLLERGATDAFASDKLLLVGAQFQKPEALTMLPDDISLERYALAIPRGDSSLRLAVNAALARIFRSGDVLKIYEKWFTPVGLRPGPLINAVYLLGALPD